MAKVNFTQGRLVERAVFHQLIVLKKKSAGEFIPTTAGLFPSVFTSTLSKAVFGLAVAKMSWMHARSVANHVFGIVPEKERRVWQCMRITVIRNITQIHSR